MFTSFLHSFLILFPVPFLSFLSPSVLLSFPYFLLSSFCSLHPPSSFPSFFPLYVFPWFTFFFILIFIFPSFFSPLPTCSIIFPFLPSFLASSFVHFPLFLPHFASSFLPFSASSPLYSLLSFMSLSFCSPSFFRPLSIYPSFLFCFLLLTLLPSFLLEVKSTL